MRSVVTLIFAVLMILGLFYALPYLFLIGGILWVIYMIFGRKKVKVYSSQTYYNTDHTNNYEQTNSNPDIIDVEYTEKEE